jgi:hypothetical protein
MKNKIIFIFALMVSTASFAGMLDGLKADMKAEVQSAKDDAKAEAKGMKDDAKSKAMDKAAEMKPASLK